jgi:hypothetical protein
MLSTFLLAVCIYLSIGKPSPTFVPPSGETSAAPAAIIFGFVGGFIKHDDPVHGEVQLAARLRREYAAAADVETFENRNGDKAYQRILALLDAEHTGTLTSAEKNSARIILYGHSWGGSEAITLARRLGKIGVPVLLTIQVDSVDKLGETDDVIPSNVAEAVNFYQSDGFLRGEHEIRAADATRTKILGNVRFSYDSTPYNCAHYPWYARIFMKSHTQIECDARVWNQVESLIRSRLSSK